MKKSPHNGGLWDGYNQAFDKFHTHSTKPRLDAHRVKAAIGPEEFYRREQPTMPPARGEWTPGGLCPFHNEKHVGSFRVNVQHGSYFCNACKAKGGDILDFIMQRDGLSFPEALERLALEWGI